jgi:hydroxymethylpyrimidine/phosphomethylpyrimidine kinase
VEFGASNHVSSAVLSYMKVDPTIRSAMNIKLDERILSVCKSLFEISEYDRVNEPADVKKKEGRSIFWGTMNALIRKPGAQVIYHKGDIGKEPMIMVFGGDPWEVFGKILRVLSKL